MSMFLPFLSGNQFDVWAITGVLFAVIGASLFLSAYVPQIMGTYRTKNTVGVNKLMFMLHLAVGLSFFWGAVFMLIDASLAWGSYGQPLVIQAIVFMILNFITSSGCLYTVMLKKQHCAEASRLGISEIEHYQRVCVPQLQNRTGSDRGTGLDRE